MHRYTTSEILVFVGIVATFAIVYAVMNGKDSSASVSDPNAPFGLIDASNATTAPDFTLATTSGGTVTLSQAVAKGPVVIDFWEMWCGPCKMELPMIDDVSKQYASRGVQFFGIESSGTAAQVNHFFSKQGVSFPILVDNAGRANIAYRIQGVPHVVVIDRFRRTRATDDGFDPNTETDLSNTLDAILKE